MHCNWADSIFGTIYSGYARSKTEYRATYPMTGNGVRDGETHSHTQALCVKTWLALYETNIQKHLEHNNTDKFAGN